MVGSKPPTSAAILLAGCSFSGILVTLQTPDLPSTMPCQNCSRPIPTGETAPIPVTTTRSFDIASNPILLDPHVPNEQDMATRVNQTEKTPILKVRGDVLYSFANGCDLFRVLIRNFHPELFFKRHNQ